MNIYDSRIEMVEALIPKNGNIITRIQGANVDALKNELNKLN
jgi:hypothetical protein